MTREKWVENTQAVLLLALVLSYLGSLYHFLVFYSESSSLSWVSVCVSAFLFALPWTLAGFLVMFSSRVIIISLFGLFATLQTILKH
ncbi:hypothetical protein [Haemophilus parainfluenzae]|jgi:hypothetical protein|uniref:hypothetical protein n=1 Tax=Haemophilus parainfluenzae TaxID=729 RepID=UPI000DAF4197|nr:hypothetical protein [Haemophilus parainfluenzae]RDE70148.1 hypothetical protein DPV85_09785 [Haemophilus parainfluenzae]